MKISLKNIRYRSLIAIMAVVTSNYNYPDYSVDDTMQPNELSQQSDDALKDSDTSFHDSSSYNTKQDTILLPLHNIILNANFTPQEKISLMQDVLHDDTIQLDINAEDGTGRTALNLATHLKADPIIIKFLIESKANVNKEDRFNETPLHNAIRHEEIEIAKMLLAAGANVELKNDNQETPIDLARSPKTQALFDNLDVGTLDDNKGDSNLAIPNEGGQMPNSPNAFDDEANRNVIPGDNGTIDDLDVSIGN